MPCVTAPPLPRFFCNAMTRMLGDRSGPRSRAKLRVVSVVWSVEPSDTIRISQPVGTLDVKSSGEGRGVGPSGISPFFSLRRLVVPFEFDIALLFPYSCCRYSTASANMMPIRFSSLYAGTTSDMNTSASSISISPSEKCSFSLSASCARAWMVSCQQRNGLARLVSPLVSTVLNVFSDPNGLRGKGAAMNMARYIYARSMIYEQRAIAMIIPTTRFRGLWL